MTDPNLRRWLRLQTVGEVGLVPLDAVRNGVDAVRAAFEAERAAGRRLVVADATVDEDLRVLGRAIAGHRLVTGGSGIALGLPDNFRARGRLAGTHAKINAVTGNAVVLCGSCSTASRAQVAEYLKTHPGLAIDPADLVSGRMSADMAAAWFAGQSVAPIIYSTADPDAVSSTQSRFGRAEIAETVERFFGDLAVRLVDGGVRRLVVGGGETSGAVVAALGVNSLRIGGEIDPGVPALLADRGGPFGLALKSGNFGAPDFFAKALDRMVMP